MGGWQSRCAVGARSRCRVRGNRGSVTVDWRPLIFTRGRLLGQLYRIARNKATWPRRHGEKTCRSDSLEPYDNHPTAMIDGRRAHAVGTCRSIRCICTSPNSTGSCRHGRQHPPSLERLRCHPADAGEPCWSNCGRAAPDMQCATGDSGRGSRFFDGTVLSCLL